MANQLFLYLGCSHINPKPKYLKPLDSNLCSNSIRVTQNGEKFLCSPKTIYGEW